MFPKLLYQWNSLAPEHLTGLFFYGTTSGKHCPMLYLYNLFRIVYFSQHRHKIGHMLRYCRNVISYYWQICTPSDDFCCNLVTLLLDWIIFRNVQVNQYEMTGFFFACFKPGCCPVITLHSQFSKIPATNVISHLSSLMNVNMSRDWFFKKNFNLEYFQILNKVAKVVQNSYVSHTRFSQLLTSYICRNRWANIDTL